MQIQFLPLHNNVEVPQYATAGSSGFDLVAHNFKQLYSSSDQIHGVHGAVRTVGDGISPTATSIILLPHSRALIGCGFKLAIPHGYEMQVRPRSGLALKQGLTIVNSPGTVDSDYRGEIGLVLLNTSEFAINIAIGERLAQGVIMKVEQVQFRVIHDTSLDETDRGEGGYGSTDKMEQVFRTMENGTDGG